MGAARGWVDGCSVCEDKLKRDVEGRHLANGIKDKIKVLASDGISDGWSDVEEEDRLTPTVPVQRTLLWCRVPGFDLTQ